MSSHLALLRFPSHCYPSSPSSSPSRATRRAFPRHNNNKKHYRELEQRCRHFIDQVWELRLLRHRFRGEGQNRLQGVPECVIGGSLDFLVRSAVEEEGGGGPVGSVWDELLEDDRQYRVYVVLG